VIAYDNAKNYFYGELAKITKNKKVTKSQISYIRKNLFPDFETGKMRASEFYEKMAKTFGIRRNQVNWAGNFAKLAKINKKTIDVIKRARKNGYTIAYLTNVDYARYAHMKKLLAPYRSLFSFGFASCYMHMRKPKRRTFEYVLKKMGISAKEAVFIDNEKQNVIGAKATGIKSILFKNNSDLLKKLRRLGVV